MTNTFFRHTIAGIYFESLTIVNNNTQQVTTAQSSAICTDVTGRQSRSQSYQTILYAEISELHQTAIFLRLLFLVKCFKEPKKKNGKKFMSYTFTHESSDTGTPFPLHRVVPNVPCLGDLMLS